MGSNAVSQNAVSSVVGYKLDKGYFNPSSPNLPQNINILAEANTANQSGLSTNPTTITNANQAGLLWGYGSPIHSIARILFPQSGGGVSVPVNVYPQVAAVSSAAKVITITPTGTATANGTIFLNICGREVLDGGSYAINIVTGDTPTLICNKMRTAVAAVLGCPILGSGTTTFVATAKWTGLSSNDINITVDLNGTSLGTTYAVVNTTAGSGTPAVTSSLTLFGNAWNTIVINSYGLVTTTMDELEAFNGIPVPDPGAATGRYGGTAWKPFVALSGTCLDDPTSLTSGSTRPNNVTIVPCVAPLSPGMPYEAAANAAVLYANIAQNSPHLDIINQSYPDMPPPPANSIPQMNDYNFRQFCVTNGCSTVDYVSGVYVVKDFVTTYNAAGEVPPFYRWVRDLNIHFNFKYGYFLQEQTSLVGKAIANDTDIVLADNVIKPKDWKSIVTAYVNDCVLRGLLVDAPFTNSSIDVTINSSNPNRMDTTLSVKISGVTRIAATTVTGGFNFGG